MPVKTVAKGATKLRQATVEADIATKQKTEMADAHCHLDLIGDPEIIRRAINNGVETIITNGINFSTSRKAVQMANNVNIFAACGVDPETAAKLGEEELDEEIRKVTELIKKREEEGRRHRRDRPGLHEGSNV